LKLCFDFWLRQILLYRGILLLLLCFVLVGCADGLILEPVPSFDQPTLTLPTHAPTPAPSPVTPFEIAQAKVKEGEQYLVYLAPVSAALFIFGLFFRFLGLIYELSTTAPD
jgi:hypothetical protein